MVILPVNPVSPFFHLLYELLPAVGSFLAVQDGQGDLLDIAFHLPLLCLLQELIGVFLPCHGLFPVFPFKGLSLFRDVQALFPALCVAPLFQFPQVGTAPLKLVPVFIVHRIDDKVRVYVFPVLMRGDQNLEPFPCRGMLRQLHSVPVGLLRSDLLVCMVALDKMFIGPAPGLSPQLLCGLHFVLGCFRLTVEAAHQLFFCFFFFCHIIKGLSYSCF